MPVASQRAPCSGPAYLLHACALYRQPECSQLKDYLQFLMPALVLKIILSLNVFLMHRLEESYLESYMSLGLGYVWKG